MLLTIGLLTWLLLMFSMERIWPRRGSADATFRRVGANLFLGGINWGLARLLVPGGLVLVALFAEVRLWGAWPFLGLNGIFEIILSIVFLDLAIWLQHWASHCKRRYPQANNQHSLIRQRHKYLCWMKTNGCTSVNTNIKVMNSMNTP